MRASLTKPSSLTSRNGVLDLNNRKRKIVHISYCIVQIRDQTIYMLLYHQTGMQYALQL